MRCVWFGCLALAIGCGSSDGDGDGGGIRNTPLGQLEPGEADQACELLQTEYQAYLESLSPHSSCSFIGAWTARQDQTDETALREQCASYRDECLTSYQSMRVPCMFSESCSATVAEFDRCFDDLSAAYSGLYDDTPECETLTLQAAQALTLPANLPAQPASCTTLEMKCGSVTGEPEPEPSDDPLIAACMESCERFEATCSKTMDPTCSSWCYTEQLLGEDNGCLAINQSFYDCGRTAELDCRQDNVRLAVDGACGILDVTYCQVNEGVSCGRAEVYDTYCAEELPGQPEAFTCVSSVPFGECVDHPGYGGIFRCCPAGTSF